MSTNENDSPACHPVEEQLNSLFGSYRAEWLREQLFDLFTEPNYFPGLTTNRPCVLVGGRGMIDLLVRVRAMTLHRRRVRYALVDTAFRCNDSVICTTFLHTIEAHAIETSVVTRIENVVAVLIRIVANPLEGTHPMRLQR